MDRPEYLDEIAKNEWDRIMALLVERTEELDFAVVLSYCIAYESMVKASKELSSMTLTVSGAQGNTVANPLIGIRDRAMAKVALLAVQLGLTPRARQKTEARKTAPRPPGSRGD